MNVLPWLLNWPPTKGQLLAFLLLTAFSAGTLVAFGGTLDQIERENVTVEAVDLEVRLNDELRLPEEANGTVQGCLGSGTPPDSIGVVGDVTLGVPREEARPGGGEPLELTVSMAYTDEREVLRVEGSGDRTSDVHWLLADDETLSPGDPATVQLAVRAGDTVLTRTERTVTVQNDSRSYDC